MPPLSTEHLERYLTQRFGGTARVGAVIPLGEAATSGAAKEYGYGKPVKIEFTVDGKPHAAVLNTTSPGPFGHEHMADRAQMQLWNYGAYNSLPGHVRALDVARPRRRDAHLRPGAEELFLLVEHVEGTSYIHDVARLQAGGGTYGTGCRPVERAVRLPLLDPPGDGRQPRPVRPPDPRADRPRRMHHGARRQLSPRLRVHTARPPRGDRAALQSPGAGAQGAHEPAAPGARRLPPVQHPFPEGTDFTVLDRSRGEWGEPADDVTALTGNYLFASLQAHGRLQGRWRRSSGHLGTVHRQDRGRGGLDAAAPFFAFRCLVMASPVWYPSHRRERRRKLFSVTIAALHAPRFEPARVNEMLRGL